VALVIARGLTRKAGPPGGKTIGTSGRSDPLDHLRAASHLLLLRAVPRLPGSAAEPAPYQEVTTLEGLKQVIAWARSPRRRRSRCWAQGGGFFNANSAIVREPEPLTTSSRWCHLRIPPADLDVRRWRATTQGWALWPRCGLCIAGVVTLYWPRRTTIPLCGASRNSAGLRTWRERRRASVSRFGALRHDHHGRLLRAVNAMHDSFTPLGGLFPVNIQLGEVISAASAPGLRDADLRRPHRLHRRPDGRAHSEYLGKKIEAREMKLAMLYVLIFPAHPHLALGAGSCPRTSSLSNAGRMASRRSSTHSPAAGEQRLGVRGLTRTRSSTTGLGADMLVGRS